jgi:hypothetical protein
MTVASVLRVFKNSFLVTGQGEIKISRVFDDGKAARKARYRYYLTVNGVAVYARRNKAGNTLFAVADR